MKCFPDELKNAWDELLNGRLKFKMGSANVNEAGFEIKKDKKRDEKSFYPAYISLK